MPDGNPEDVREIEPNDTSLVASMRKDIDDLRKEINELKNSGQSKGGDLASKVDKNAAELKALEVRVKSEETWRANLQGQNGIDVNGSIISFNGRLSGDCTHTCLDGQSQFQFTFKITG